MRDMEFRQLFDMLTAPTDVIQLVAVLPATGRVLLTIFAMQWSRSKPCAEHHSSAPLESLKVIGTTVTQKFRPSNVDQSPDQSSFALYRND